MDPRGFPTTLPEFQRVFPDDAACASYLEHLRWPHGFTCCKCENIGEPYRLANVKDGRVAVPRLSFQYLAYRWHPHATKPHAAVYMVLGDLPGDHADAGYVGSAVSAAVSPGLSFGTTLVNEIIWLGQQRRAYGTTFL